jgi:hypothetical protein
VQSHPPYNSTNVFHPFSWMVISWIATILWSNSCNYICDSHMTKHINKWVYIWWHGSNAQLNMCAYRLCRLKKYVSNLVKNLGLRNMPSQTCPFMYLCFYNILSMLSRLNVNELFIQWLVWCYDDIVTHYDNWSLYYNAITTSYQWLINTS